MHLLLTDETNQRPGRDAKFFILGGLIVPFEAIDMLHNRIETARTTAGYREQDELKFETNARPDHVSVQQATEAKRQVISAAQELGCKFIAHVIHHEIIRNQNLEQQVQWAADYVIGRFNYYLSTINDTGICAVDNLPVRAQFRYLSDKFSLGLSLPDGSRTRLDRIRLLSATCANASHLSSAMDIVLGAFRYCLNNPRNQDAASEMMKSVVELMWHEKRGDDIFAVGKGLIVRPELENIRKQTYRRDYDEMFTHINRLLE